jgi:hypothetical protein
MAGFVQIQPGGDPDLALPAVQHNRAGLLPGCGGFPAGGREQPESLLDGGLGFELAFAVVVPMKSFTDRTWHKQ